MTDQLQPPLQGLPALVTGAASGIGLECARQLARAGALVAMADLAEGRLESAAGKLKDEGLEVAAVEVDITDSESCRGATQATVGLFGPGAILVNCAGVWTAGSFGRSQPSDWERDIGINLLGTMRMTHAWLAEDRVPKSAIVNIGSDAGRIGEPGLAAYSAAKAGVIGFTKAIARELARKGVRANCICPSMVQTPANDEMAAAMSQEEIDSMYPLGRIGQPADIAGAVLYLASPASEWVTGQVLSVNGGYTTVG